MNPNMDKVCYLISLALMSMYGAVEQQYFLQLRELTWEGARNHCQVCFKDLVTLTPTNTQSIARQLTSDSWVGLRKNFHSTINSPGNSSKFWSRWANGDPLAFQNWYPGWPMFKTSLPKRDCCSCSCTCPAMTTHRGTSSSTLPEDTTENVMDISSIIDTWDQNATSSSGGRNFSNTTVFTTAAPNLLPVEATCVRSPMLSPEVPDTDHKYIEDSCVVMLTFGAWVEKNCLELLPFVCYEDCFFGQANATNVTSRSATLTWLPGPGGISHYRVEVKGDKELVEILTNLNYDLVDLTAGTNYAVQVYPVKCERDLNPHEIAFYTIPNKVENLSVTEVTETSISLSWSKPAGNVDFYRMEVQGRQIQSTTERQEVVGLIPGSIYTFTVISGVEDNITWSEQSSITKYTKPGKVSDLRVSNNTNNSLLLNWVPPKGNTTGYWVKAVNNSNDILFNDVVNITEVRVTGLPMGTKITLSVTALANDTLEGDKMTIVNYTAPGSISHLHLNTTQSSLTATWNPPEGNYSSFTVKLQRDGNHLNTTHMLAESWMYYEGLMTAANYTVMVYTVSGHLCSPPVESSNFTLPAPPINVNVSSFDKKQITFQWTAPVNTATVFYSVKLNSSFWGHSWSATTFNSKTNHTFGGLKSGTRYEFEVRTEAGGRSSNPKTVSHFTEADEREISLSMLCSSAETLLCDKNTTRESVFHQLHAHFNELLGNKIFWKLEMQETEN